MKKLQITRKLTAVVLLAVSMSFGSMSASAVPLEGSIGFFGLYEYDGTDLEFATMLDITSASVIATSGSFDGLAGEAATFSPFDFTSTAVPVVSPLWTVTNTANGDVFSFDLDDVTIDGQTSMALNLSGTGTLMGTGFDDTAGIWTFSGDDVGAPFFTFSSISATTVSEPGTAVLLGLGLIGIGFARRRLNG